MNITESVKFGAGAALGTDVYNKAKDFWQMLLIICITFAGLRVLLTAPQRITMKTSIFEKLVVVISSPLYTYPFVGVFIIVMALLNTFGIGIDVHVVMHNIDLWYQGIRDFLYSGLVPHHLGDPVEYAVFQTHGWEFVGSLLRYWLVLIVTAFPLMMPAMFIGALKRVRLENNSVPVI